jgi:putative transposase
MTPLTLGEVMKRAWFTDEQIVRILQAAGRTAVAVVAKRYGVSKPSIYAPRKKFGEVGTDDLKRLKHLEQENKLPFEEKGFLNDEHQAFNQEKNKISGEFL